MKIKKFYVVKYIIRSKILNSYDEERSGKRDFN